MVKSSKIYVAGHTGLVGSAIVKSLRKSGHRNLALRTHEELDLTDPIAVEGFFNSERPEFVLIAAAKVGGILANSTLPAEFIFQNLRIQTNIIHQAYCAGAQRVLFLGSSCIYPRLAEQPIKEATLLSGALEATNRPYAVAKIAGIEMCWAYNRQHGTKCLAAMPTNLYGPKDNYDSQQAHFIPAIIRKMHEAKISGADHVTIWGTGRPRREFLYSEDAADAFIFLMNLPEEDFCALVSRKDQPPLVNVGFGSDITIQETAQLVAEVVGFVGTLVFDPAMPDGTPRKLLDTTLLNSLGWKPKTSLQEGLHRTYDDFCTRFDQNSPSLAAPRQHRACAF